MPHRRCRHLAMRRTRQCRLEVPLFGDTASQESCDRCRRYTSQRRSHHQPGANREPCEFSPRFTAPSSTTGSRSDAGSVHRRAQGAWPRPAGHRVARASGATLSDRRWRRSGSEPDPDASRDHESPVGHRAVLVREQRRVAASRGIAILRGLRAERQGRPRRLVLPSRSK